MRKPTRAKKKVSKKTASKKTATKKTASKKKKSKAKKAAPLGCCTLMGSGPDEQREGITREACRLLAISKKKNFSWFKGVCAEPN